MSVLSNTGIRAGASGASGDAYQIAKSLRFNRADTAYLNKAFSSTGNKKQWTYSLWVKKPVEGASETGVLLEARVTGTPSSDSDAFSFRFNNSDKIQVADWGNFYITTTRVFRDPSAWYHLVLSADTTQASNNLKLYVNGVLEGQGSYPHNTDTQVTTGSGTTHEIGARTYGSDNYYLDAYLAEVHLIDGQTLDPSSFGETNADTGQWVAKKYAGSYGTNGFYLKFDGTDIGTDSSGNGNDWTANNLTVSGHVNMPCVSFDGSGDYLSIPDSADFTVGSDPFTIEFWAYKTSSGEDNIMGSSDSGGSTASLSYAIQTGSSSPSNSLCAHVGDGSSLHTCNSGVDFVLNRWVHVAFVRDGNTLRLFQNGIQMDTTAFSGTVKDSADSFFIGRGGNFSGTKDFPGYISNFHFVKGTALYTANFTPSTTATKHANTKLLCCQSSSSATEENSDSSHTITATNASATTKSDDTEGDDQFTDSPTSFDDDDKGTGNYATWNPLRSLSTFKQGNLSITSHSSGTYHTTPTTLAMTSGKWYCEMKPSATGGTNNAYGIMNDTTNTDTYLGATTGTDSSMGLWDNGGTYRNGAYTNASYCSAFQTGGEIIGLAFDVDNGTLKFYINGVDKGNAWTDIPAGTWHFCVTTYQTTTTHISLNCGQQGFAYTPPTGYKALNTYNLPDPTITDPSKHFDVGTDDGADILSTGTGLTDGADFVWIKDKANSSTNHILFNRVNDSGMDGTPHLRANAAESEATCGTYSAPSGSSVAWVWNAGSSNTSVSAGDLNTASYDTSEDWSASFANGAGNTTDVGQAFRGITTATGTGLSSEENSGSGYWLSLTDVAFDVTSTISVWVQDPGSIAVSIEYNGTTYTNSSPTKFGWTDFTVPAGSNSGTLKARLASSGDEIRGVKIDGKILVDSNVTPPNMPSIASTNRVNTDAGFSIVSYTGNNTAGATISHGLNAVPSFMIVKERESTGGWVVYHKDYGGQKYLYLHSSASIATSSSPWNNSPPTSTVLSVGSWSGVNGTTDHIAYCWSEVEGYSKFGTYTGNGNTTDGPFCWCGFRPRYVITKGADANDWFIRDTTRSPYNVIDNPLRQDTGAEYSGREADILSNGFKLKAATEWAQVNTDGVLYYWAAFAESPFKYANAR